MRFHFCIVIALTGLGVAGGSQAQTRLDFERCRSIVDDLRRLSCYDGVGVAQPRPSRSKYAVVALAELKRDALSFRGRLVEVAGWLQPDADLFRLKASADDAESLPVDVRSLSRQERQAFTEACGSGCEATIQGEVRPVGFTTGIVADLLIAPAT